MSKKNATNVQPLSASTKKALLITAIVVVAAIIMLVSVLAVVNMDFEAIQNPETTPDMGSSTLTIKNGDFAYKKIEGGSYPYAAQNWKLYSHDKSTLSSDNKMEYVLKEIAAQTNTALGIVNLSEEEWAKVVEAGITVANPGLPTDQDSEVADQNVYMIKVGDAILTDDPTNAGILSDTFRIAASSSAKITLWVNVANITEGNATVSVTSSYKNSNGDSSPYDKDLIVKPITISASEATTENGGWVQKEIFVTNNRTDSQYLQVTVALGDIYTNTAAKGTIFVDDILFDSTITANEPREQATIDAAYCGVIESTDTTTPDYVTMVKEGTVDATTIDKVQYLSEASAIVGTKAYSPFMPDEPGTQKLIYKLVNDGTQAGQIGLRLENAIKVNKQLILDTTSHLHISFWLRVAQDSPLAQANVYLQQKDGTEWVDIDGASFTKIETSQKITEDANCGWVQYSFYVSPGQIMQEVSLLITLGERDGYKTGSIIPSGTLYVMQPGVEFISQNEYATASTSSYVKKTNLLGDEAVPTVSNGSFTDYSNVTNQPTNWLSAFAGDLAIYKDGKGDTVTTIDKTVGAVLGSGIAKDDTLLYDDQVRNVLKIQNNTATSYGYLSNNISVSAKTVTVFSVLAKGEGNAIPYIYLLDNGQERDNAVIAKVEGTQSSVPSKIFCQLDEATGWTRYYIVVVADEAMTVRIALFNGSIDGTTTQQGTVYFDQVSKKQIGTFTFEVNKEETKQNVVYTAVAGYEAVQIDEAGVLTIKDGDTVINLAGQIVEPTAEDWAELTKLPEETDDDHDHDHDHDHEDDTHNHVDVGLLLSVISSVILVAALGVAIVVRIYKKKARR